jgi:hypothetical protein
VLSATVARRRASSSPPPSSCSRLSRRPSAKALSAASATSSSRDEKCFYKPPCVNPDGRPESVVDEFSRSVKSALHDDLGLLYPGIAEQFNATAVR